MTYAWSEHAAHVQTLFRPWAPGDGYSEEALCAAESALGVPLPAVLRAFYSAWGTRDDLCRKSEYLLPPEQLFMYSDALVFCVESQAVLYWAIPRRVLQLPNPPISVAETGPDLIPREETWTMQWQESHDQVSDFLDALTYLHAFRGGAVHCASSREPANHSRIARIKAQWQEVVIKAVPFWFEHDAFARRWPLYVRDGQAIDWVPTLIAAARSDDDLDEISRTLDIAWDYRQ